MYVRNSTKLDKEIQYYRPPVEYYRKMNHKTMLKAMSKNILCLQKLPVHDGFSYECLSPGTVSASHTTVLLLLSQATSVTMEMSDVVFTVPSTVLRCAECRAAGCRYSSEYNALAH